MADETPPLGMPGNPIKLTDPKMMRALAHPARFAILTHLALHGPATATECADVAGLSPSACSYHLRTLARYGITEEDADSAADGRQRPLGIATPEDKIVQRAVVEVLNAVYEADFLGFSYGFRPGRSPHNALDALTAGIYRRNVNWVLDADIRDFFGQLDRDWLRKFLRHRIADERVLRLIGKWLAAGVVEEGVWSEGAGAPQGASASPLLANVYLHYVLDLFAGWWRRLHPWLGA